MPGKERISYQSSPVCVRNEALKGDSRFGTELEDGNSAEVEHQRSHMCTVSA